MPVIVESEHSFHANVDNKSMTVLHILSPSEDDPSFHGSVHTATLAVCTVLVIFVVVLGTFGNGLVLLSALQCRKRRSNAGVLVFNLAGTDFIICSCLSPTFLYLLFSNRQSTREFCGGLLLTSTACGILSLLTLVAIAAHRESQIRGRLKGALSPASTACILSTIYFISFGTALGGTLHVTLSWVESHTTCQAVMNSSDITTNNVVLFFISPVVIVSFIIILVCYSVIARAVRTQTYLRVKALQPLLRPSVYKTKQTAIPSYMYTSSSMQKVSLKSISLSSKLLKNDESLRHCSCCICTAALDKENKAATMCFVVILIITLCWTPLVISHFIEILTGKSVILFQVKLCGVALVFLNSGLNPYMYAQNSGQMKHRYGRFLWDILHCQCRIFHQRKLRTFVSERSRSRTLGNPTMFKNCGNLQFLHEKPQKLFKNFDNCNVINDLCNKDQKTKPAPNTYSRRGILCGSDQLNRLATSMDNNQQEVRHSKTMLEQTGKITDVRLLVQKTCYHVNLPGDHSLTDS